MSITPATQRINNFACLRIIVSNLKKKKPATDRRGVFVFYDTTGRHFTSNVYWDFVEHDGEIIITHCQILAMNGWKKRIAALVEDAHRYIRDEHNGIRTRNIVRFDCKTQIL